MQMKIKPVLGVVIVLMFAFMALSGCENEPRKAVSTEASNLVFLKTSNPESPSSGEKSAAEMLNEWLRKNPQKKIVSIADEPQQGGASGFILYFIQGDNSKQKFELILKDTYGDGNRGEFIQAFQAWVDSNLDINIVTFSTVSGWRGGIHSVMICYEEK
jgi:hypothetical protein